MLSEMHLRRKSTPDEMVDSFYSDVIEIAKKRNYEFNECEKPLLENEFYFDDKDIVLFSLYQHENEIFRKPLQICVGEYFMKDLDEFLRVKHVLYQQVNENHVHVDDSHRILKINDIVPLIKLGMIVKAIINLNKMHLIWSDQLDRKIRKWFYWNEDEKDLKRSTGSSSLTSITKRRDDEEDDSNILNAFEMKKNSRSYLSRKAFNNWFDTKFTNSALLKQTSLMEIYASTISRTIAR